ncbi:peptide chain release factor N(5)-glutamine methyltransferase [Desulfomarina sp.]
MDINELLRAGTAALENAGIASSAIDARVLLQYCLGRNHVELLLHGDEQVDRSSELFYFQCIDRRKNHEPVAYILRQCEFWSLPFSLTTDVLIPRPETEFLLDRVLAMTLKENLEKGRILDLCCGSGVISVVLARETGQRVLAVDISSDALAVAAINRNEHDLTSRIDLLCADLCSAIYRKNQFSLIVTNPPYVRTSAIQCSLEKDVAGFEPHLALDGGEKGLDVIRKIRSEVPLLLVPGGEIFMEIGADQGAAVENMFLENDTDRSGFVQVRIITDYAGLDRVLYAQLEY